MPAVPFPPLYDSKAMTDLENICLYVPAFGELVKAIVIFRCWFTLPMEGRFLRQPTWQEEQHSDEILNFDELQCVFAAMEAKPEKKSGASPRI